MNASVSISTFANIGGFVLLGCGAAMILLAFVLRRRRSPRCPRCGYDLDSLLDDGDGPPRCPECGVKSRTWSAVGRTPVRRRWLLAGACITLSSNLMFAIPRVAVAGWIGAVPTFVLAMLQPWHDPSASTQASPVRDEMSRRWQAEQLWSPAAELLILRTELAFLTSGRWGVSDAELERADRPRPDAWMGWLNDQSLEAYLERLGRSGRRVRFDLKAIADRGLDPASLKVAVDRQIEEYGREGWLQVVPASDPSSPPLALMPVCFRGDIVLTPDPDRFAVVTSFPRFDGTDQFESQLLFEWLIELEDPWHIFRWSTCTISAMGSRVLVLGDEVVAARLTRMIAIARAPTPRPWAPVGEVELARAASSLATLESTVIEGAFSDATIADILSIVERTTSLRVYRHWDASDDSARLRPTQRDSWTAFDLLDAVVERGIDREWSGSGGPWCWTLAVDGTVHVSDRPLGDPLCEALVAYDLRGFPAATDLDALLDRLRMTVDPPSWNSRDSTFAAARRPAQATLIARRLLVHASLITHARIERFLRAERAKAGTAP
jgi:hypothetical protein